MMYIPQSTESAPTSPIPSKISTADLKGTSSKCPLNVKKLKNMLHVRYYTLKCHVCTPSGEEDPFTDVDELEAFSKPEEGEQ